MVKIRLVAEADAATMVALFEKLDTETQFMLMEPGERQVTVEEQAARHRHFVESDDQAMFVAIDGDKIVGFSAGMGGGAQRVQHTLYIVIGVARSHWGQGVGTELMRRLEEWAIDSGFHRLELTVMVSNEGARALYRKCGFEIEGTRRHSTRIDGQYVDEVYMSKLV